MWNVKLIIMSASKKLIRDCQCCQQVIKNCLVNCQEWEVKRKETLEKIQEEECTTEEDKKNIKSYGECYCQYVIDKKLNKYYFKTLDEAKQKREELLK